MDLLLKNKTALITGASKGIGRAIALRLAAEGMNVAIAARSVDQLQALADQIHATTAVRCLAFPVDLSYPTAPGFFADAAMARFGQIDLVVNNAGATQRGDFLALSEQAWADGFALKFFAAVRLARAAWPHLAKSHGSIINIAGVGGRTGSAEFTIGGSVNAAMLNLTKSLADRAVHENIRVNAINPGYIATDRLTLRIKKLAAEQNIPDDQAAALITKEMNVPRFGQPEEVADAVTFLASDRAGYINGSIIDIDGGLTRTL